MKKSSYVFAVISGVFLTFVVIGIFAFTVSMEEQKEALGKVTEPLDEIDQARENEAITVSPYYR